ncbi:MAG: hypothetical protein ACI90V_009133 [Bacillariaceae sp.]|jgi:hypothetical protein
MWTREKEINRSTVDGDNMGKPGCCYEKGTEIPENWSMQTNCMRWN